MYCIDDKLYPCSTSLTMKYIGGKWEAVILIHLIEKRKTSQSANIKIMKHLQVHKQIPLFLSVNFAYFLCSKNMQGNINTESWIVFPNNISQ